MTDELRQLDDELEPEYFGPQIYISESISQKFDDPDDVFAQIPFERESNFLSIFGQDPRLLEFRQLDLFGKDRAKRAEFLAVYRQIYTEKTSEFKDFVGSWSKVFIDRVQNLINEGVIDRDINEVKSQLQNSHIIFEDPLTVYRSGAVGVRRKDGTRIFPRIVHISLLKNTGWDHTLTHEEVHNLLTGEIMEDIDPIEDAQLLSFGFESFDLNGMHINEGMTEYVTKKMMESTGDYNPLQTDLANLTINEYIIFESFLNKIKGRGLDINKVIRAFSQNRDRKGRSQSLDQLDKESVDILGGTFTEICRLDKPGINPVNYFSKVNFTVGYAKGKNLYEIMTGINSGEIYYPYFDEVDRQTA